MFLYGVFYNAAGIGCTGPVLLSLVLFALTVGSAARALGAFAVFSLVMGTLMVGVTVLAGFSQALLAQRLRVATGESSLSVSSSTSCPDAPVSRILRQLPRGS